MKIATFNANGIRAAAKKGFWQWVLDNEIDIIGIQETKIQENQINPVEYEKIGYYNYWDFAEKKGYSGVATFSKIKPILVENGMGMDIYDREGRVLRTDFEKFTLINVYIPSGTSGEHRHEFKMRFLHDFEEYINKIKKHQKNIIVLGDYNIVHQRIDIHNPDRKDNPSGYRPDERAWLDKWFHSGFYDAFRLKYPDKQEFSWWSYRAGARPRNKGWRIDYISVSEGLRDKITDVIPYKDPVFSDHCPVVMEIKD
jgi:exodeoxyribonuclease-3